MALFAMVELDYRVAALDGLRGARSQADPHCRRVLRVRRRVDRDGLLRACNPGQTPERQGDSLARGSQRVSRRALTSGLVAVNLSSRPRGR